MKAKKRKQKRLREYRDGYHEGYRLGMCEAVQRLNIATVEACRPFKLMYVPQGFHAIDTGVTEALQQLVSELVISTPESMLETAAREMPEAVLVMNGLHVFPENHLEQISEIRKLGIATAIWFVDDPYFTENTSLICRHYDHIFTHELACVEFYQSLGASSVHYLPLCVNPKMFYPRRTGPQYQYDIVFIGNAFRNRTELFDELAPYLKGKKVLIAGGFWERLTTYEMLSPFIRSGFIPPEETANYYSGSKIVINIHRPWEAGQDNRNSFQLPSRSINPRTYEISACGTMQLTDVRDDLGSYYRPGYDLDTFGSAKELQEKIDYYLKHEKERRLFALRGAKDYNAPPYIHFAITSFVECYCYTCVNLFRDKGANIMNQNEFIMPTPPLPLTPAEEEKLRGRLIGFKGGYNEGYLRGRLAILNGRPEELLPVRNIHVMYVASGKGYPYSPLDDAVICALQKLTVQVTITDVRQNLVELAAAHRPNLVLVLDGMDLPLEQIASLRASGIKTAIWLTDDPYYTDFTMKIVNHYDYVFTLERNCIDFYKGLGCTEVHYLPFAAHREHYRPTTTRSTVVRDVSFIGSAYWNRVNFFREILPDLMSYNTVINGIWWDRLPEAGLYGDRIEIGKWMSPQETAVAYSGSKIVINLHRSHIDEVVNNNTLMIPAVSPNPRTFEIAATGTLQLCDARDDLSSFYKPDEEIVTFASPQEMMDKIRYYLTHEEERLEIALRAFERTLKDHTYLKRLDQLLTVIYG